MTGAAIATARRPIAWYEVVVGLLGLGVLAYAGYDLVTGLARLLPVYPIESAIVLAVVLMLVGVGLSTLVNFYRFDRDRYRAKLVWEECITALSHQPDVTRQWYTDSCVELRLAGPADPEWLSLRHEDGYVVFSTGGPRARELAETIKTGLGGGQISRWLQVL